MAIGTPNPDFDAEPWCTDEPPQPEIIIVQEDIPADGEPPVAK